VRDYWQYWRTHISDIKALVVCSGDFMAERAIQETVRLLPQDVPLFMILCNDDPATMGQGNDGDSLCGSLSASHNVRMIGRRFTRMCRINTARSECLQGFLQEYLTIADGIECLRNMRLAMIGVNPNPFATTFTNQLKLFEIGFSLQTYELMTMWGDTVLAAQVPDGEKVYRGEFGEVQLWRPIARNDARIPDTVARIRELIDTLPDDSKVELIARVFLWLQDVFDQDMIDAGAIHCWPDMARFFGFAPCTYAMLANLLLRKPVVCEQDLCHAAMTKLAWALTGEAGAILDINNNGWTPQVFNVFHCSQTPVSWLKGPTAVSDWGAVEGLVAPTAFTAVSAATSADDFRATVFQGRMLNRSPAMRGSSGWAYVPNCQEVLKRIEDMGIHHVVFMKGHIGELLTDVLAFRGINVTDMSLPVAELEQIESELPEADPAQPERYEVFSR
jgi:L-fucose isomerase-like protein